MKNILIVFIVSMTLLQACNFDSKHEICVTAEDKHYYCIDCQNEWALPVTDYSTGARHCPFCGSENVILVPE